MSQTKYYKAHPSLRETITHGLPEYPIKTYRTLMKKRESLFVLQHWHPEIELVLVKDGSVAFYIGDTRVVLNANEGLFINSGVLHGESGLSDHSADICYILFHPSIISSENSRIYQKYILPIIYDPALSFVVLHDSDIKYASMLSDISTIIINESSEGLGYELVTYKLINSFWTQLVNIASIEFKYPHEYSANNHDIRIKAMISYINQHFCDNISLTDIATAANISTRECQRCFKQRLSTTPFEYLKGVRIEAAAELLRNPMNECSISNIALACGFNGSSYFGKCFMEIYGTTPHTYRKKFQAEKSKSK